MIFLCYLQKTWYDTLTHKWCRGIGGIEKFLMVCLDPGEEINPCFVVPWIGLDLCKSQSLDDRLAQGMIDLSGMYLLHGGVDRSRDFGDMFKSTVSGKILIDILHHGDVRSSKRRQHLTNVPIRLLYLIAEFFHNRQKLLMKRWGICSSDIL